jgi:uncharacterized protein (TIGR00251 family)
MPDAWYHWQGESLILNIRVQPRASRDEITEPHGGQLKIRLTAPPTVGKANQHLLKFLGKLCGVARNQFVLLSGTTARSKRVRIDQPKILPNRVAPPVL